MILELKLPRPHVNQQFLLDNRKRFNVLKCGRRWGKTEFCQELFLENFEKSQIAGYFAPTYKDLHETWKQTLINYHAVIETKSETVKQILFINGAKIDFWSMEDPDSGRGRKYHTVIMDECEKAGKFQEAWEQAIAATLTDFGGSAYFLSTPQFGDTFFKKLCKYEEDHPNLWKTFVYTTYDNPHMPREEIELMRSILPPVVFDCEYLALDVDGKTLNPFAHHFHPDNHVSDRAVFRNNMRIIMSIDFNLEPFALTLSHIWEDKDGFHDHQFDEIEIPHGSIQAMADELLLRYKGHIHKFEITGDAMGNKGELSQRDNASFYLQLLRLLGLPKQSLKVFPNPLHENSKPDCNYVWWLSKDTSKKCEFLIHPNCKKTIFDLKNVQWDVLNKQIVKRNRKNISERGDFLDTVRYKINVYWRKIIKLKK